MKQRYFQIELVNSPCCYNSAVWYRWSRNSPLALIRMAGGVYDYWNFEQVWLHIAWSNKIFWVFM